MLAAITFLTPVGALAALAALVPLVALAVAGRRHRAVARGLGLTPVAARRALVRALAVALPVLLLGIAAGRPAVRTTEQRRARTDAQAFFVLDVSRSMLAAAGASAPTRLERAREAALRLRAAVPEVPAGVAGLTDRVLPYVFPTIDPGVFRAVVVRAATAESPPPREVSAVATSFDALADLQRRGYFPPAARRRLCVVLTDGESRPFAAADLADAFLGSPRCRLVVVRVGGEDDRLFGPGGEPEPQFRPLSTAASSVEALASATGGQAFTQGQLDDAARTLQREVGSGPTARVGLQVRTTELAPYLAGCAAAVVLGLLLGAVRPRDFFARAQRTDYDHAWTRA
jgi:hypothetical protein